MPTGQYERFPGLQDGVPDDARRCSKCLEVKPRNAYSPDRRSQANGLQSICKACRKQREADWRAANPEEHKRRCHANYLKHRARKDAYGLEWRKKNRHRVRAYALKDRYKITLEQYATMLERQGHACAICRRAFDPKKPKAPHIDHDHATGKIRGVLCGGCNIVLGHMEKPGFVDSALAYLAAHSGRQIGRSDLNATFSTSNVPS